MYIKLLHTDPAPAWAQVWLSQAMPAPCLATTTVLSCLFYVYVDLIQVPRVSIVFILYGTKCNFLNMGKVFCVYLYIKRIRANKSLSFPGLQLFSRELAQALFLVCSNLDKTAKVDCVLIALKTFTAI